MTREKLTSMKRGAGSGNACPSYVHSRITLYHASKIDLRYCRSLHSCAGCRLGKVEHPCGAVHYGICAAVAPLPAAKLRKGSSASSPASSSSSPSAPSSPVPSSPASPSGKSSAPANVYYSSASITSTGRRDGPKSRSLAILREGHELAPWSGAYQSGLVRLQPQRHVIVHGGNVRIGGGGGATGHPAPEVVAAARGGASGVAITFQRGQTNITSSGNTDIKIQGQGHEIHIQGGGGQNIRVHPAGGRAGHVIRIQGQGHGGNLQYQSVGPDRFLQSAPSPVDSVDSGGPVPQFPVPKSYSSTKQIISQKPTARVAPAPVPTQTVAPAQTYLSIPESLPCPPPPLTLPPPLSPNSSCPTPPFPVSPPTTSLSGTPSSTPPVSPSPGVTAPVATVTPTAAKQSILNEHCEKVTIYSVTNCREQNVTGTRVCCKIERHWHQSVITPLHNGAELHYTMGQNSITQWGRTPLHNGAELHYTTGQNSITQRGRTPLHNGTELHYTMGQNSITQWDKTPLHNGTELHYTMGQNSTTQWGRTSLHYGTELHYTTPWTQLTMISYGLCRIL
ncbi:hypothetical protein Btru_039338 [Bulinus truncatus]|nr:hypothetical protein Btru_039338 [Bulinus truncatus]